MANDQSKRKKPEKPESAMGGPGQNESPDGPSFDEVVRKMLNTPPKPKKQLAKTDRALNPRSSRSRGSSGQN